jgi:hypothetical protein
MAADKKGNRERMLSLDASSPASRVAGETVRKDADGGCRNGMGRHGKDWEILPIDFNNPGRG